MFFGFFRRREEELIDQKLEELFEKIRSEQEQYWEQNRQIIQEQLIVFRQSIKEGQHSTEEHIKVCLEQIIRNSMEEKAGLECVQEIKKELARYREENEQQTKYIMELFRMLQSIKDSVDNLQRQVEELSKGRTWAVPFQWTAPVQPQVPPSPEPGTGVSAEKAKSPVKKWTGVPLETDTSKKIVEEVIEETLLTAVPIPVFTCDREENKRKLAESIFQCGELKKILEQNYGMDRSFDIYHKLLEKCQKKLSDLLRKVDEKDYDSEKLAGEMVKLLKQTMIKALSQEAVRDLVDGFLIKCGLRKIEFKNGDKLNDKDYDYIDDLVLYEEVDDITRDNRILEIKQDAYVLDYMDEYGEAEAVIPGIYKIGRYKDF